MEDDIDYKDIDWLKFCRYYKGESKNPYDKKEMRSTYWEIEYMWINDVLTNENIGEEYIMQFFISFPDMLHDAFSTPTSLMAFMYDQFLHSGGRKYGFLDYMYAYVENS